MAVLDRRERLTFKARGTGSSRGRSPASRAGDVLRGLLVWAVFAGGLALTGPRGRRAAAVAGLLGSREPASPAGQVRRRATSPVAGGRVQHRAGDFVVTSSHTSSDLGFLFGARGRPVAGGSIDAPDLGLALVAAAPRKHYSSDVVAGGSIGPPSAPQPGSYGHRPGPPTTRMTRGSGTCCRSADVRSPENCAKPALTRRRP